MYEYIHTLKKWEKSHNWVLVSEEELNYTNVGLVVPSLVLQIGDSSIESQVGRVDGNFPRDPGAAAD